MPLDTSAPDPSAILREGHPLVAVDGPNFSGRTEFLKTFCARLREGHIYVGPEVYNALSGLTSTVRQEIELHYGDPLLPLHISGAVRELGLDSLLDQHPGTISGGEQACLSVLCGLALLPKGIAIDCGLEQLDQVRLSQMLDLLGRNGPPDGALVVDNRLHEWPIPVPAVPISALRRGPLPRPPAKPIELGSLGSIMGCMAPSIRIDNLCAGYRRRPNILRQLSLSLKPGIYSLSGPNGAGKSTLAKVLSGVLRPTAGAASINGKVAKLWREPGRLVVFGLQNPDVSLFEITVLDELRAGAGTGPAAERRVAGLARAFGLTEILTANPLSLPFPIRKRVSLAATLACPAPWYFLDEPALGADRETTATLAELIKEVAAAGHGVIAVSHSHFFHASLAGIPLRMHEGRIQEELGCRQ